MTERFDSSLLTGTEASAYQDQVLAPVFPAVFVCDADGGLLGVNEAGEKLLPEAEEREQVVAELAASALESLLSDSGGPSVAVGSEERSIEGIAVSGQARGGPILVMHMRDASESPAIEAIARQNQIYEAVLRTGPIFVHVYDRQMNSRWSTSALRPELGFQPERPLTAEENYSLVHPDDIPADRRAGIRESSERAQGIRRVRVRNAEGEWRWLAVIFNDLLDDPAVGSVVVHAWDVSEEVAREREIEEARQRLAALIDTLDEAVVVVDDERIVHANKRVVEMFPATETVAELIGSPVADLARVFAATMADPKGFARSCAEIAAAGESVTGRMVETADGRTLEQNFLAIGDGGRQSSRVWVHRDITEQLQLKRRQQRVLELERGARQTAEEQARRLEELDALRTEFVASVSHELRTPLSAISSYVELLLDPAGPPLSGEQRGIAESIERGAGRLARIVDDLLELARLQSGVVTIDRQPFSVSDAVREAADEVVRAGAVEGKELTIDVVEGPQLESDRDRLIQILANLLGNAAKFAAGKIRCCAEPSRDSWTIEVSDDGPGIPVAELETVFEPFHTAPETGGEGSGSGLGLAISSRIAAALGGSLALVNGDEGGLRARLVLPLGTADGER